MTPKTIVKINIIYSSFIFHLFFINLNLFNISTNTRDYSIYKIILSSITFYIINFYIFIINFNLYLLCARDQSNCNRKINKLKQNI